MSDRQFKELPKIHTTYAKVIKSLLPKGDKRASQLPKGVYQVEKLTIDQHNLKDYRRICGFVNDGRVPATYFAVLSQALQMNMMAGEDFPFAMLGLVHVENSVTQYRNIFDTETVSMAVHLDNLRAHDAGQQFDFVTKVYVGQDLVWEGVSTYLSRQKQTKSAKSSQKTKPKTAPKPLSVEGGIYQEILVPEDMGRRYAFVSGDFNLIHLHSLSARAFGFPKAIAHGMWTKAKSLAQIAKTYTLPEAYRVDVSFKAPVFLPSTIELISDTPCDLGVEFGLYAKDGDRSHLVGSVAFLDKNKPIM